MPSAGDRWIGEVRAKTTMASASRAPEVHSFVPVTCQPSRRLRCARSHHPGDVGAAVGLGQREADPCLAGQRGVDEVRRTPEPGHQTHCCVMGNEERRHRRRTCAQLFDRDELVPQIADAEAQPQHVESRQRLMQRVVEQLCLVELGDALGRRHVGDGASHRRAQFGSLRRVGDRVEGGHDWRDCR